VQTIFLLLTVDLIFIGPQCFKEILSDRVVGGARGPYLAHGLIYRPTALTYFSIVHSRNVHPCNFSRPLPTLSAIKIITFKFNMEDRRHLENRKNHDIFKPNPT